MSAVLKSGDAQPLPMRYRELVRFVLIPRFCDLTGYTDKAVRRKIEDGVWREGREYVRAPDGHITMDLEGYEKWVVGEKAAA